MFLEVAPDVLALLMAAAFFAGIIDSIAGGGGLITLPVLMLAGAPPVTAIATNKIQGVFGTATAAYSYARAGHVDLRKQVWPALVAFIASICGAVLTSHLPVEWIKAGLPFLLVGIALFFALKPGLDDTDRRQRLTGTLFAATVVPLVGFYDGLVGPGAGSFYMIGFVLLAGYGVLKATAHTKLLNLASNVGGMLAFAIVATPWWITGLLMGVAQIAGAYVGSRLAMRVGARIIKPLLVVTSSLLAIRLLLG
ncbi:conserved inner membrane protein [Ketogulonicigenium robustum]|uniref:Probable membrane transporter protein n=1 Tax=Ketogulonicigenium robustum TaxID=92947 RepID=A0A1W6P2T8_9RHOB|nr:TSUP family transporter [Ketogulonicigenium robustum]ARO15796.1 conserved inner membrane protein [Ketogulonicigenium robustum]